MKARGKNRALFLHCAGQRSSRLAAKQHTASLTPVVLPVTLDIDAVVEREHSVDQATLPSVSSSDETYQSARNIWPSRIGVILDDSFGLLKKKKKKKKQKKKKKKGISGLFYETR
ncbi:hypothetical protein Q8A73_015557 [Channa argus]|nr:hypothetical protein Q8A73_015557 [Channa argus]